MKSAMKSAMKSSKFKSASWRGVIHPDRSSATDLIAISVRLPKELENDLDLAVKKYADWFDSKEEFIATAAAYAIQSMAEDPPSIRWPKRSDIGQKKRPTTKKRSPKKK